jgi:hypothetical protein
VEELLEAVFSLGPCGSYIGRIKTQEASQSSLSPQADRPARVCCDTDPPGGGVLFVVSHCIEMQSSLRQLSTSKDVNTKAEGSMALEAITRQQVKAQQT